VREFFRIVADTLEFHAFAPREFHAVGNTVFVLGTYDMTVRESGRRVSSEWVHVFWLNDGKVKRYREFTDTARFAEAWRG
jgi:ketosteroid isomerase-like protein